MIQVTKNVIQHQLNTYIESKGRDPQKLSAEEMNDYKEEMMDKLFRGKESLHLFFMKTKIHNIFEGLEQYPDIFPKTMNPKVNPEQAARSVAIIKGEYDKCEFGVGLFMQTIQRTNKLIKNCKQQPYLSNVFYKIKDCLS